MDEDRRRDTNARAVAEISVRTWFYLLDISYHDLELRVQSMAGFGEVEFLTVKEECLAAAHSLSQLRSTCERTSVQSRYCD